MTPEKKTYISYVVSVGLVLIISFSTIFLYAYRNENELITQEMIIRGRAHFSTIVMARRWNAGYGGVYVEKKPGVASSPFLKDPDVKTADGRVFTLKVPAIMTREISAYSKKQDDFSFNITSLKPLNPENRADEFERRSLLDFENGKTENFSIETINGKRYFRYMAPLRVEKECLPCHAGQGYRLGQIRGGISISFLVDAVEEKMSRNAASITVLGILSSVLVLALVGYFTSRLFRRISATLRQIETMAITDQLTEVFNRRYILGRLHEEIGRAERTGGALSCLMIDIDHFKSVNDEHGHQRGDEVLREVTDRMRKTIRQYDIPGRYGGEEFVVVMPDADADSALASAERIREEIKSSPIKGLAITVSIGAATFRTSDKSAEALINRADENLYRAKNTGRDRVCGDRIR